MKTRVSLKYVVNDCSSEQEYLENGESKDFFHKIVFKEYAIRLIVPLGLIDFPFVVL